MVLTDHTTQYFGLYYGHHVNLGNHSAINPRPYSYNTVGLTKDLSSFMFLHSIEEEDRESVNHGIRRNIENHLEVVKLGKKTQRRLDMLGFSSLLGF